MSGTKADLDAPELAPHVGHLTSPRTGTGLDYLNGSGLLWAADNDCFSGFDEAAYRRMIERLREEAPAGLRFVTAPDVVGDARSTLGMFDWWLGILADADEGRSLPVALVGQDGMEDCDADFWLGMADALFIGGSTEWKLSRAAADLAREAKARGLWVHMGRVNSLRRLRAAYDMGCDSVDGTAFSWFTRAKLGPAVAFLRRLHRRPPEGWRGQLRQASLFAA